MRPARLADLDAAGFDYWALGHIHKRSEAREERCAVVMPGMPQGRDIGESGPKTVTLVTVADDRTVHIEERLTGVAQFESVPVDLTDIDEWRDMLAAVADGAAADPSAHRSSEHLVARLHLTGRTKLAWRIRNDRDLLRTDIANQALDIGKSWIDKIEIECRAGMPPSPLTSIRSANCAG